MTSEQADAILRELPAGQRNNARDRILFADVAGWRDIGLWVWNCCRRHEADLVGVCPAGTLEFIHWQGTALEDELT